MFTSFKPSFKKTWFFCSLSLPSVLQPVRRHSGQNLELCPSFPKSGKASHLSSWLIHLEEVKWFEDCSFPSALVGFVCHLLLTVCSRTEQSLGAQGIQKKGCWAGAEQPQHIGSPLLPHLAHLELENNPDLLGKLLWVADTDFKAVKCGLQVPWLQYLGSTNYKAVGMLSHPFTFRVTSTFCSPDF